MDCGNLVFCLLHDNVFCHCVAGHVMQYRCGRSHWICCIEFASRPDCTKSNCLVSCQKHPLFTAYAAYPFQPAFENVLIIAFYVVITCLCSLYVALHNLLALVREHVSYHVVENIEIIIHNRNCSSKRDSIHHDLIAAHFLGDPDKRDIIKPYVAPYLFPVYLCLRAVKQYAAILCYLVLVPVNSLLVQRNKKVNELYVRVHLLLLNPCLICVMAAPDQRRVFCCVKDMEPAPGAASGKHCAGDHYAVAGLASYHPRKSILNAEHLFLT